MQITDEMIEAACIAHEGGGGVWGSRGWDRWSDETREHRRASMRAALAAALDAAPRVVTDDVADPEIADTPPPLEDARYPRVRVINGRLYVTLTPSGPEQGLELQEWHELRAALTAALATPPDASLQKMQTTLDPAPGVSGTDLRDVLYALGIEPNDVDRLINRGLERGRIFLGRELRIVASPAATPPARDDGVEVRAAVGFDRHGEWTIVGDETSSDDDLRQELRDRGIAMVAIITARVSKPQVPTIPAAVQEAER